MEKKGVFKRHTADCKHIQYHMQKIINGLRLRWDHVESPPLLNVPRTGPLNLIIVSPKQYDPFKLMNQSKLLRTKKLYSAFQTSVLALWQIRDTKDPALKRELVAKRRQCDLSEEDLKDQLRWLVQHSHSYFQLYWISVK